jgi:hypothetical protein
MRKITTKIDPRQEAVDSIVKQLQDVDRTNLDLNGLVSVLAENNAMNGKQVQLLQDALARVGSVQPVINIEQPVSHAEQADRRPTKWTIQVNRNNRGDAESYDLVPHLATIQ